MTSILEIGGLRLLQNICHFEPPKAVRSLRTQTLFPFIYLFRWPCFTYSSIQKIPFRIHLFYQFYFLFSSSLLYLFLSEYCIVDIREVFIVNKIITIIPARKSPRLSPVYPMLGQPLGKIICHTSI